ncbi:DUF4242 domain-containing protein [Mycolicibacterium thermoresistibile]
MALYLYEIVPAAGTDTPAPSQVEAIIKQLDTRVRDGGGELIETQVTQGATQVFAVAEFDSGAATLDAQAVGAAKVTGPDEVRLVGADLADIKAARPKAGYLVEWDIPAEIDMDTYLTRKKANSPKYADIPEVSFLRTYVREDVDKCLCFYDAPDEDAVRRAREVVSTPVDRLHRLQD